MSQAKFVYIVDIYDYLTGSSEKKYFSSKSKAENDLKDWQRKGENQYEWEDERAAFIHKELLW